MKCPKLRKARRVSARFYIYEALYSLAPLLAAHKDVLSGLSGHNKSKSVLIENAVLFCDVRQRTALIGPLRKIAEYCRHPVTVGLNMESPKSRIVDALRTADQRESIRFRLCLGGISTVYEI